MGLPLINWILIHEFQGPIVFGIKFVKINFYTFFAQLSPLFSDRLFDKITDLEIWLSRPSRWKYVSTTKFFRAIEVVQINEKDKIDESFRFAFLNNNRFPLDSIRYKTHAYSFKKIRSEPFFKSPSLPKLANIDSNDQSDDTNLFYIDLYIRFGCCISTLKVLDEDEDLSWFEMYRKMHAEYTKIRPDSGMQNSNYLILI